MQQDLFTLNHHTINQYLQKFGNSASIGFFHPHCKFFGISSVDGIIGYRIEKNCIIGIGDPVCSQKDRAILAGKFNDYCKAQKKKLIYVMVSECFTNEVLQKFGGSALQFGHEIIIDSSIDIKSLEGRYPSHVRQRHKKALLNGVTAREYNGNDQETKQELANIGAQWMANRKGPQIFLLPLDIAHASSERWFYAKKDNQIIGFLMLNRIGMINGWVLNGTIILTPDAPKGTPEFLMLYVLETLRNEGYKCLSIGPTISSQVDRLEGFGWLSRKMINGTLKAVRRVFDMHERQRFWKKFLPRKEPSFVLFGSSRISLKEIHSILRVFNVQI
jgi:lysylphosphatidylglycerol synthetase-like protein (DUF2156 family)